MRRQFATNPNSQRHQPINLWKTFQSALACNLTTYCKCPILGVGISTLTSNLAHRAAEDSARVGIYDTDPQATLKSWGIRRDETIGLEEIFRVFSGVDDIADGIDRLNWPINVSRSKTD